MTPREFLAEVLPSPGNGYYCFAELTKKKQHVFSQDMDEAYASVDKWVESGYNAFQAMCTFEEPGKRTAANAKMVRSLFADLDGYASPKEAAVAFEKFMQDTGLDALGQPWIVKSGGGIHCYWPFTKDIPIAEWKPIAENLLRLFAEHGTSIDKSVTADAARLLRPPGSYNFKAKYDSPRLVKLMVEGDKFDFDVLAAAIMDKVEDPWTPPLRDMLGDRPDRTRSKAQVKLVAESKNSFEKIMVATEAGKGCAQLKHYMDNAEDDGMEPLWRGLLSWTKFCEDGIAYAEQISEMHPYDKSRMEQKLDEIVGPYSCVKMDQLNPGVCTSCPMWQKMTNPLRLASGVVPDNEPKEIVLHTQDEVELEEIDHGEDELADIGGEYAEIDPSVAQTVIRPPTPRGFVYGKYGGVYAQLKSDTTDGEQTEREVQILPYEVFVIDLLKQEEDHLIHLAANRPDGAVTFTIPQEAVVSKDTLLKALASRNVLASFGAGNDKHLFAYIRACVEEASLNKKAQKVPTQLGWQDDGSFVYSGRVFRQDGTEQRVPMPDLHNLNMAHKQRGTLEEWARPWNMLVSRKMYMMLAVCLDSFGAPLMHFTDYDGFTWHIGSSESGTGKSLALSLKAGVWGHPIHYRTSKGTSPVALQNRLGMLNSLPLLMDEITAKARNDMEWVPEFCFDTAEGKGKERMESSANKERRNTTSWSTTATLTSNTHMTDYMSGVRSHASEGELMRMLEWTPSEVLEWSHEEREALACIKGNFGVAGEAWVRWLVTHQQEVRAIVKATHARLAEFCSFRDQERYWHADATGIVASAIMLGPKYANLLQVPVLAVSEALRELVSDTRTMLRRNVRTAEDVLNAYTRDNYGSFVVVRRDRDRKNRILASFGESGVIDKSLTRSRILGRVEHGMGAIGYVDYFIEEQLLRGHCAAMSYGYKDFKKHLEEAEGYFVKYLRKDMTVGTNGPTMRVNVMHISRRAEEGEFAEGGFEDAAEGQVPVGDS